MNGNTIWVPEPAASFSTRSLNRHVEVAGVSTAIPLEVAGGVHRHITGVVEAGERQRDLGAVCGFVVLGAGGRRDLGAVRVPLLLAGDRHRRRR